MPTSLGSGGLTVRRGVPADREPMARVHVDTWKTTYRGLVPDEALDTLTYEGDLAAGFGSWLLTPPPGVAPFVALTGSGELVGYAFAGPCTDEGSEFAGELLSIYVLKTHQGKGVGSALVRASVGHLLERGWTSMVVWVLEGNPYRRFYERLGGRPVGRRERPSRIVRAPLVEVGYGWRDIRGLSAR
jgi:GNAT superfamily N-acetyltransferase